MAGEASTGRPSVALLGCGAWGSNHLRVWRGLGHLRVVCDTDPARGTAVKAAHPGLDVASDPAAVLLREDVDAVVIATPASTHAPLTLAALQAGKDVLVEKPMALTATEAEGLAATAEALGRILAVGHVIEHHPAIGKLRELHASGMVGRIRYLYANRLNFGRIRTVENALWSFAPHDLAIMLRLLGVAPEEVVCHGGPHLRADVVDGTLTSLRFPDDVYGHIFVSWLHPFKEHRFVLVGDRQMAVFDDTVPWPSKLLLYPHSVDWIEGRVPVAQRAEAVPIPLDEVEPLAAECQDFLRAVITREPPLTDGWSGVRVLRVVEAAQRSLERGGHPQPVPATAGLEEFVHPTATVDPGAELGHGSRIWHYSHVMPGVKLGRDCVLGQNVFVGCNVRIGDGVKLQNNVSVYEGVELEDHVFCGPSAVFTNVREPRSEIDRRAEFRRTLVRRGATLGANCTVVCGVTIGSYAFVGAGAVVTRDVPDNALVVGVPARITGWVCRCGARLPFTGDTRDTEETSFAETTAACPACEAIYRRGDHRVERVDGKLAGERPTRRPDR